MNNISTADRMRGAIWGELVGDSASLKGHWTEDLQKLKIAYPNILAELKKRADWDEPENIAHDESALMMLQSVADCHGFSAIDFGTRFLEFFADPKYTGPLDEAVRGTIQNYQDFLSQHPDLLIPYEFQDGANDDRIEIGKKIAPVIIAHWEDPELMSIVESATIVTQNNETAVAYMQSHARIVRAILQGYDLSTAFEQETILKPHDTPIEQKVRKKILEAIEFSNLNVFEAVLKLGHRSALDQSFPAAVHATLRYRDSYPEAILETICAGGDYAGRAGLVGTWLGVYLGNFAIPEKWKHALNQAKEIERYIEEIVQKVHHPA